MTYTRELARIKAVQHSWIKNHYGRQSLRNPEPVSFESWFLIGIRRQEKKGAEFDFLSSGLIRIKWPEKIPMLRTVADFEREYQNYLSKY